MRVSHIRIRNIIGIEAMDLQPGSVTRITGPNGVGKSSIVRAIQACVKKGSPVEIIRDSKPADQPAEVGILIEDEGGAIAISKEIKPKASPVVKLDGQRQDGAQAIIDQLFDALAVNPIDFLDARPDDQVKWLLSAMPYTVTVADFEAAGVDISGWTIPDGVHGLVVLDQVHEFLYARRRDENVQARQAHETAERLRASLPTESVEDLAADRGRLLKQRDELKANIAGYREKVKLHESEAIREIQEAARELIEVKNREIQAAMETLSRLRSELQILQTDRDAEIAKVRAHAAAPQKTETAYREQLAQVDKDLAVIDQRSQEFQRGAALRAEFERHTADAADHKAAWERYNAMLDRIADMRKGALSNCPIKGVEIREGEIWYRGHRLSTQNEATRIILALKVVAERVKGPGRVPLICLDGGERLAPDTNAAIDKFAEENGLQIIITRVTQDPEQRAMKVEVSG